jgi:hypothetical protein
MKYWPAVHFHATREHGQKLARMRAPDSDSISAPRW